MSNIVQEMLSDNKLTISDRELTSSLVDQICEMISGYLPLSTDPETFRKIPNLRSQTRSHFHHFIQFNHQKRRFGRYFGEYRRSSAQFGKFPFGIHIHQIVETSRKVTFDSSSFEPQIDVFESQKFRIFRISNGDNFVFGAEIAFKSDIGLIRRFFDER